MVAAHSEDAVYVLPGNILNAPLEGSESAAADVPLASAELEDDSEDDDAVEDAEGEEDSVVVTSDWVTVSAVVAWATDVSVTIVPEGMSATEESDFVPVMGMGVEMMLVRAVTSSEAVVCLASFAVVAGAADELPDEEPPVIVNLGLELPESPKTDHLSVYTSRAIQIHHSRTMI